MVQISNFYIAQTDKGPVKNKRQPRLNLGGRLSFGFFLFLADFGQYVNHFFPLVRATIQTSAMTQMHLSALLALGQSRSFQGMVRTAVAGRGPSVSHSYYHIQNIIRISVKKARKRAYRLDRPL